MRAALDEAREGGPPRRRDDRPAPRRGRVHLRRGDRAARVARGQARPAAAAAAVPARARACTTRRRRSTTSSTIALVPEDHRARRRGVREDRRAEPRPGTAVFSLSGNVANPGNYERPLGTTIRELIYDVAGGVAGGRELKAIIPGGSSVPVLTPDQIDTPMDYDSIGAAGSFFGSAAIIVVDDRCCMVQLALRAAQFYMHESCGKCTPCRVGTRWLVQLLTKIEDGHARGRPTSTLLDDVCDRMLGKSLCALGDFAVYPVSSYLRKYRDEFEEHVRLGGCPFHGELVDRGHRRAHRPAHAPSGRRGACVSSAPQPELVSVTVDDRPVQVPKGTGVVEAAMAAGIEIPVFCYEPRLGPPVGACRMCLVEIEGMPKLQAGCTLTVSEGMVVRTAHTSPKAAEGQESTLEFILVNHPLDCPVCDKGGECPLQDLDLPLRARLLADALLEGDVRQADPGLAAHRARPRALHPLLPLHALLGGGRRGRAPHRAQPRRDVRDRDVRGRAVPVGVLGQRHRAVPGRRADVHALPLRRRGRGRSRTCRRSAPAARSDATSRRRSARGRCGGS